MMLVGLIVSLSIVGFGWTSAAPGRPVEPPAGLSEYVYLHVTRSERTSIQDAGLANSCRGTADGIRS